jgi:hypothetical protein
MSDHWDEFSKSLAEKSVPRRQTLRLLGAALAGAILSPLGVRTAWARGPDPCKAFCRCRNKSQQNACLAACRACGGNTSRLCGSCGSGYVCTDLASDFDNCGACGAACAYPGPYEDGACVDGHCFYSCVEGAVDCGGTCTDLGTDPDNCGACGNVCPELAPYCNAGECSACAPGLVLCGDSCVDLAGDPNNCGACGNVCPDSAPACFSGACTTGCVGSCPAGWCGGDGCGGECACPVGWACGETGWCYELDPCPGGQTMCSGVCYDLYNDSGNCGTTCEDRKVCGPFENCTGGVCVPND